MDGDALVSRILGDELAPYVKTAAGQSVVLVAHGPNEESENEQWLRCLRAHARRLQERYGLRRVEVATLRDDAPRAVREAATEKLRELVRSASTDSKVLALPVLISVGHIQQQIEKRLSGLEFTMVEGGLANHPLAAEWVRTKAAEMCAGLAKTGKLVANEK